MLLSPKILVVDDQQVIREQLLHWLTHEGYRAEQAATGRAALTLSRKTSYQAILLDWKLPDVDGFEVLEKIHQRAPNTCIIVLTGYAEEDTEARAIRTGAFAFFEKPINYDGLRQRIETAVSQFRLEREDYYRFEEVKRQYQFQDLVAQSEAMHKVFDLIQRVAETEESILITGDSGTGKELIAVAIHDNSPRRHEALIKADCAGLHAETAESELFGHLKGAFTGAIADRIGKFELAHGTTLFLDEIGDLSPQLQLKFLRFLQDKTFERMGSNKRRVVDVRIVAATNKNLPDAVAKGLFREDLFHRLNRIVIQVPPLRERQGDIPLLIDHFVKKYNRRNAKRIEGISEPALKLLEGYHFSGNVRELENIIASAILLEDKTLIQPEIIRARLLSAETRVQAEYWDMPHKEAKEQFERLYFSKLLEKFNNNVTKTADYAGMDRSHVTNRLKALGLRGGE